MKIYRSIEKFINSKLQVQSFIPTMGNLHQGHLSLITKAKKNSGNICVSLYVKKMSLKQIPMQKKHITEMTYH